MDLVSFETAQEYEWVKGFINGEDEGEIGWVGFSGNFPVGRMLMLCLSGIIESSALDLKFGFPGNVPYFWTSGRLCDFDGCDRPDFFPKNINGWFWSANQVSELSGLIMFISVPGDLSSSAVHPGPSESHQRLGLPGLVSDGGVSII